MSQGDLDLYHALKEAGVSEERAEQAAKSVAGGDRDLFFIKGMLIAMLALMLGLFWLQWSTITEVAEIKSRLDVVDGRLVVVENRLGTIESRVEAVEGELAEMRDQLLSIDGRLGAVEAKLGP